MPREAERRSAELRAGIFIVVTLGLLIFSILWLRYFAVKPEMTIIAKFIDPGPIAKGLQAYYQGVNVGRVSRIEFSKDFRYTLVYVDIYKKDLRLPANVTAEVKQEGITGQKYIDIIYPEHPVAIILADGYVIQGKSKFGINELQEFFGQQIKNGRMERVMKNLEQSLANLNVMSGRLSRVSRTIDTLLEQNREEINTFIKSGSNATMDLSETLATIKNFVGAPETRSDLRTAVRATANAALSLDKFLGEDGIRDDIRGTFRNINQITGNIRDITGDTEIRDGLRSTFGGVGRIIGRTEGLFQKTETALGGAAGVGISPEGRQILTETGGVLTNLSSLLNSTDRLITNLNSYTGSIYEDIKQSCLIENASCAFYKAGSAFDEASGTFNKAEKFLERSAQTEQGKNVGGLLINTLQNHNQAAKQVDCLAEGLSEMLSKRFLLIRLLFGKPGAELEECRKLEQYNGKQAGLTKNGKISKPCPVKPVRPYQKKPYPVQPPNLRSKMNQEQESLPCPAPVP